VQETDDTYLQATGILKARPEVKTVWARTSRCCGTQKGFIYVVLKDKGERELSQKKFEDVMDPVLKKIPGVHMGFQSNAGFSNRDISITLTSNDNDLLEKTSNEVRAQMAELPFLANVNSTAAMQQPEILIKPRLDIAAEQGVSVTSIGQVARIATLGDIDTNVAKFTLADRQVPIRVQLDPKWRGDIGVISNLRVRTVNNALVPLETVAEIGMGSSAATINRFDRARKIAVEADLHGKEMGDAMKAINELPALKDLPAGVSRPAYGNSEQMQIMFIGFIVALVTGFMLNIAILVLLFRNLFQPFTIMSVLPLSFGGAFAALLATHMALSMPALIGIIMLMGIVTKNSILLAEYAIMARRDRGMSRLEALVDAGAKRARPIVMTTIAMVAGMTPIALGLGNDAEFRQPMAVAVIGGLITSTLLSLVLVPVVFTIVDDIQHWIAPKFGRWLTPKEEPQTAPGE